MQITKEEILRELRERKEEFSKEEVLSAIKKERPVKKFTKQKLISGIAYAFGSLIILLGVFLLIGMFWEDMGFFFKVGVTFGMGVLLFAFVVFLEITSRGPRILKEPLSFLSGVLVFVGGLVAVKELSFMEITPGSFLSVSLMLAVMFASLYVVRRSPVYLFFIIASATSALYSAISFDAVLDSLHRSVKEPGAVYAYLTSLIGLSYLHTAYLLKNKRLSNVLYFLGGLSLISPLFFLADIYSAPAWNILAVLLITAIGVLGHYLKRSILAVTGGVLLIGVIFSFNGLLTTPIFFVLAFIFFLIIKKSTILPYIVLVIASLTVLPYVFLSLKFIQQSLVLMDNPQTIYLLLTSLIGVAYIVLGHLFQATYARFSKLLYFLGTFAAIFPLFFMGDIYSGLWDVITIFSIFAVISLGVYLQEKVIIISGGLLLGIHVTIISYRYFADSIGWPITLIIAGFMLIGVGYLSYLLSRKVE